MGADSFILDRTPLIEAACRTYHVTCLELVGTPESVDFKSLRYDPEFIVSYEPGFMLPWAGEHTGLQKLLEAVYNRPIHLVMEGSRRAQELRASADLRTTTLYAT